MDKKIPPQLLLLSIIAQSRDGLTIGDLVSRLRSMYRNGWNSYYSFGKRIDIGIPSELLQDINVLKLLNLVEERGNKLVATQKAYDLLSRIESHTNTR
ncbi:MAG: hypothetical protein N3D82_02630 [Ignisphaera sp.]|nr:hypothetical protein [Ignisphaera sp.]MCX8167914.1 hypothetical protein [Ignisphaera sp.]MDW8085729.1 hypothetical protein [Ignisphaera sp.]